MTEYIKIDTINYLWSNNNFDFKVVKQNGKSGGLIYVLNTEMFVRVSATKRENFISGSHYTAFLLCISSYNIVVSLECIGLSGFVFIHSINEYYIHRKIWLSMVLNTPIPKTLSDPTCLHYSLPLSNVISLFSYCNARRQ